MDCSRISARSTDSNAPDKALLELEGISCGIPEGCVSPLPSPMLGPPAAPSACLPPPPVAFANTCGACGAVPPSGAQESDQSRGPCAVPMATPGEAAGAAPPTPQALGLGCGAGGEALLRPRVVRPAEVRSAACTDAVGGPEETTDAGLGGHGAGSAEPAAGHQVCCWCCSFWKLPPPRGGGGGG